MVSLVTQDWTNLEVILLITISDTDMTLKVLVIFRFTFEVSSVVFLVGCVYSKLLLLPKHNVRISASKSVIHIVGTKILLKIFSLKVYCDIFKLPVTYNISAQTSR